MKQENLYKLGLGIFALWEIYYSYWWFAIHRLNFNSP
jgi:hypothetical protein